MRLWKSRVDCWYEPHRDPGEPEKEPQRVVRHVVVEAPDSDTAIAEALAWAESTASPTQGRRWLSFEHRSTGAVTLPMAHFEIPEEATHAMVEAAVHACDGLDLTKMSKRERSRFKARTRWKAMREAVDRRTQ